MKRRWHRIAIPFAVVGILFTISGVSKAWETPNFDEPGTLSPTGTGPDGSSRLAALLAQRNVPVERVTSSADAVRTAQRGRATIFLPHPDYPNPHLVRVLAALPADNRILLVAPGVRDQFGLPLRHGQPRWAPRTLPPRCADAVARQAGRAAAMQSAYKLVLPDPYTCYGGGLVGARWNRAELVVVGATDPFRNSRIGEHGNAALAAGLLSTQDRVVWLDLHAPEPVSRSVVEGGRLTVDLPNADGDEPPAEGSGTPNPLWTAVPSVFWAVLVQVALVAVLLALWRARRLGPPVPEPLPVVVPAAETVTGRGRLYERADARGAALDALRAAARYRILPVLDLPPEAAEADVVTAVARRAGVPEAHVRHVLYGPEPPDDAHLLAAATALDTLVAAATHERTRS